VADALLLAAIALAPAMCVLVLLGMTGKRRPKRRRR
jgi:hypothetical protein